MDSSFERGTSLFEKAILYFKKSQPNLMQTEPDLQIAFSESTSSAGNGSLTLEFDRPVVYATPVYAGNIYNITFTSSQSSGQDDETFIFFTDSNDNNASNTLNFYGILSSGLIVKSIKFKHEDAVFPVNVTSLTAHCDLILGPLVLEGMFAGCSNQSAMPVVVFGDSWERDVKSTKQMFKDSGLHSCSIPSWMMNNVTTMESMFEGCKHLIGCSDNLNIDRATSKVETLRQMFTGCDQLEIVGVELDKSEGKYYLDRVKDMTRTFDGCDPSSIVIIGNFTSLLFNRRSRKSAIKSTGIYGNIRPPATNPFVKIINHFISTTTTTVKPSTIITSRITFQRPQAKRIQLRFSKGRLV
jgi:hypothetical protein